NNDSNTVDGATAIANAKLEALKLQYDAEYLIHQENKEKLALLDAKYANDVKNINDDLTRFKKDKKQEEIDDEKTANELKLQSATALADAMAGLASEHTAFAKAMAVTSAIISTYEGASKALGQGGFAGIAMMAAVIVAGLANVKKILSTKVEGAKGSTASASIQAPQINTTQLAPRQTQDVRVVANQTQANQEPLKAYVVNRDLTNKQDSENFYKNASTIG